MNSSKQLVEVGVIIFWGGKYGITVWKQTTIWPQGLANLVVSVQLFGEIQAVFLAMLVVLERLRWFRWCLCYCCRCFLLGGVNATAKRNEQGKPPSSHLIYTV